MTRKDYELIAAALRKAQPALRGPLAEDVARQGAWSATVESLAAALAAENPWLDANYFIDACTGRNA